MWSSSRNGKCNVSSRKQHETKIQNPESNCRARLQHNNDRDGSKCSLQTPYAASRGQSASCNPCGIVYSLNTTSACNVESHHAFGGLHHEAGRTVQYGVPIWCRRSSLCRPVPLPLTLSSISCVDVPATVPARVVDIPCPLHPCPVVRDLVWVGLQGVALQELPVWTDHVDVALSTPLYESLTASGSPSNQRQ